MSEELFSIKQVAAYMGWSRSQTYRSIHEGDIPFVKKGRQYFVKKSDLDEYMEKNRKEYQEFLKWRIEQGKKHEDEVSAFELLQDHNYWLYEVIKWKP